MNEETAALLGILSSLNMGELYLKLTDTFTPDGGLDTSGVRHLAFVFSDTAQLLNAYANKYENKDAPPMLVEGESVTPSRPAGVEAPVTAHRPGFQVEQPRVAVHKRIAQIRDRARRCAEQIGKPSESPGLVEAEQNLNAAADRIVTACGCGTCEPPPSTIASRVDPSE